MSGSNVKNRLFELYIEDSPFLIPGAPVFRRLLEEFEGPTLEGFTIGLSQDELSRLNANIVHVDLWDPKLGQSILKTLWKYVRFFLFLFLPVIVVYYAAAWCVCVTNRIYVYIITAVRSMFPRCVTPATRSITIPTTYS